MRLLLVEDDAQLAQTLARGLREQAFAVDVAGDGDAAVYQASVVPYDLIVLDVLLPKRSGFEVCRELRRRGNRARILMLTSRDTVEDRVQGLDLGADDYLTKPFAFEELLARTRALLRRGEELLPQTLRVADLEIDTRAQTARRGERPIPLTTKEYTLLAYLARNAGRVIGRAEISDHAWDDNYDPVSNLIEVYISRLRRKLDDGEAVPLLHTRRGAGYLLGAMGESDGDAAVASAHTPSDA
jgi:DNA-binding response OmpR family regulator